MSVDIEEETSFSEVVTAAYMLLNMYNISIDLACEVMLEVYKQDISPVPKGYLLN